MRRVFVLLTAVVLMASGAWFVHPAAIAGPAQEVVLVYPRLNEAKTLSPNIQADSGGYTVNGNIFSALVTLDWGLATGTTAYGDLAERWEADATGQVYTFTLRKGAKWHDGKPLTSADVKYTYETVIAKNYPLAAFLSGVRSIRTPDDDTVIISLTKPDVAFVPMLAQAGNWFGKIMPKHIWQGRDWDKGPNVERPIGSGPFKFVEWARGSHWVLQANNDYFRGRPKVDRVIVRIIPDPNVAQAEFRAGRLVVLPEQYVLPYGEVKRLMGDPSMQVVQTPSHYNYDLWFNVRKAPYNNQKVRDAIAYAMNRDEIRNLAFFGLWEATEYAGLPKNATILNTSAKFPSYDKARAESLLDEAGFPRRADGWRFATNVIDPSFSYTRTMAEVIVGQLRAVGINTRWDQVDEPAWWEKLRGGTFDLSIYFTRYGPDPDAYREHFSTGCSRCFHGYSNPELDRLADQARTIVDMRQRRQMYGRIQEILVRDKPFVSLFNEAKFTLIQPGWSGFPVQESGYNRSLGWNSFYTVTPPKTR